jgi:MSHA biogenesis protein MshK
VAAVLLLAPVLAAAQETLRDPTRPYSARTVVATGGGGKVTSSFKVTAIFTSDMRRIAVVNGRRVAEGDQVDGATVVEILTDRLRLNHGGKSITSRVLPNGFRK